MLRSMVAGDYEYPIFHILRQFLRPGDVFFDIGSGLGHVVILVALLAGVRAEEEIPLPLRDGPAPQDRSGPQGAVPAT